MIRAHPKASIPTLKPSTIQEPTSSRARHIIQKKDPYICSLQETHLKTGDTYRLKVKDWKKIFHANRDQKKPGEAILMSDNIDFEIKTGIKTIPMEKKCKKTKWLSEEALQIAVKRREEKTKEKRKDIPV